MSSKFKTKPLRPHWVACAQGEHKEYVYKIEQGKYDKTPVRLIACEHCRRIVRHEPVPEVETALVEYLDGIESHIGEITSILR